MAGDWIKMRIDLADDPAVIAIASELECEEDLVVGKLHRLWAWADRQTVDGNAPSVSEKWIDRYLSVSGFAQAMQRHGWLDITGSGITFPRFDRHNGQTGKRRALTAKRVASHKGKSNAKGNAPSVTSALPREEKRREEKSKAKPPVVPLDKIAFPDGMNTHPVHEAIERWLEYRRASGKTFKVPAQQVGLLLKKYPTLARFAAAVDHSIAQGYTGLYEPGGNQHGQSKQPHTQAHDPNQPIGDL